IARQVSCEALLVQVIEHVNATLASRYGQHGQLGSRRGGNYCSGANQQLKHLWASGYFERQSLLILLATLDRYCSVGVGSLAQDLTHCLSVIVANGLVQLR